MRKLILPAIIILAFTVSSCTKITYQTSIVIKDCTGTYLRINSKDFFVCNPQKVAAFENNTQIQAAFTETQECHTDGIRCMMAHPTEGFLKIDRVKK